jgi:hypothetical protein
MAKVNLTLDVDERSSAPEKAAAAAPAAAASFRRRRELLIYAREAARRAALRSPGRLVTIDLVKARLERTGHPPQSLGNTAGSVFRAGGFRATAFRVPSRRGARRGREVGVWEYVGGREASALPPGRFALRLPNLLDAGEAQRRLRRLKLDSIALWVLAGGSADAAP